MAELAPDEKKLIDDIAEYGWHVISVEAKEEGPPFCYTVGFYQTFEKPEIIIIGLPAELGQEIINMIGDDIASGIGYEPGTYYSDILEGYECFMLKVDRSFYKEYVGYAIWHYKNEDFPVIQCVFPSEDNVYPWDWSEDERNLQQPVLGNSNRSAII